MKRTAVPLWIAVSAGLASCAGWLGHECPCSSGEKGDVARHAAPGLDQQRLILAEGYSMLHKDAFTISSVRALLAVKVESDEFDKTVTEVSEYGGKLKDELERL